MAECPLLAHSGHALVHCTCPLFGGKADMAIGPKMSAYDPKRTTVSALWTVQAKVALGA